MYIIHQYMINYRQVFLWNYLMLRFQYTMHLVHSISSSSSIEVYINICDLKATVYSNERNIKPTPQYYDTPDNSALIYIFQQTPKPFLIPDSYTLSCFIFHSMIYYPQTNHNILIPKLFRGCNVFYWIQNKTYPTMLYHN